MFEKDSKTFNSIAWNRIKTGLYALSSAILAGWITDALNEDLMFRIITRYFFPDAVANYEHPFSSSESLLIWGIPLLVGILLMVIAVMMTLHHIKKKHLYIVNKARHLKRIECVVLGADLERLGDALRDYKSARNLHVFYFNASHEQKIKDLIAEFQQTENADSIIEFKNIHFLEGSEDLHIFTNRFVKQIRQIRLKEKIELALDIKYANSLFAASSMYCSLEMDTCLSWAKNGVIYEYEVERIVEN